MKKTILFLLLGLASATTAFSQARPGGSMTSKDYTGGKTTESGNTGFGIKGGYNLSSVRGDDVTGIDRNAVSGFHAGVYGQFGFNNFSSVQAEVLYSRQGFEANTGPASARQSFRLDYVSVPIMYVGNITDNLSFHIGPQASLLINADNGKNLGLAENGFNTFDYGAVGGLEARVGPARIGARYNLSAGKLFEDGPSAYALTAGRFANAKLYNNLLQVYVGFGLRQ